ncbi:unnamed protein product [Linum trigynum]|uniref:Uncharacterized protein n=1 Tax=Linum trigynum TaxID=586398 RepID=A0AAV2DYD2_9ROSI
MVQGNQGTDKGKGKMEHKSTNGNNKLGLAQEWRQVGPKNVENTTTDGNIEPKASSSKPTAQSLTRPNLHSSQAVLEMNNTKIQILAVPDLSIQQKENRNPNSDTLPARKQEHKQKKNQALQPKGINLKTTKRPLQIHSPGKKETHSKHKQIPLPISLKAIEEICNTSQNLAELSENLSEASSGDVAMGETMIKEASAAAIQEESKAPTNLTIT